MTDFFLRVIPAQAGIHPAMDTGFRRYDSKERQVDSIRAQHVFLSGILAKVGNSEGEEARGLQPGCVALLAGRFVIFMGLLFGC